MNLNEEEHDMKNTKAKLSLQSFFPEELEITDIKEKQDQVEIYLKSHSSRCICPKCSGELTEKRGTYTRKVQDLPVFGKSTQLHITAYEYHCKNEVCEVKSVAEDFSGFLDRYRRMTTRCLDLVILLALETSCEGAARVLGEMGIKISGDTIIRILVREYEEQPETKCGSVIGVDDFASKKGYKYCTVVVDEATHRPAAVLEGRDGESLREWLKENKHVKAVTRDRASAYAKVINEELPDAMQIADRFHLHNNLLTAVKKALISAFPDEIEFPDPLKGDTKAEGNEDQQPNGKSADDIKKERIT